MSEGNLHLQNYRKSIHTGLYGLLLSKENKNFLDNPLIHIKLLYNISYSFCKIEDYPNSLKYIDQALSISFETGVFYLESSFLMLKGLAHLYLKEFKDGLEATKKAISTSELPKDRIQIIGCLTNLGILYRELEKLDLSISSLEESLKLSSELNDKFFIANNLYELSLSRIKCISYTKAQEHASRALYSANNELLKRKILIALSKIKLNLGEVENSINYIRHAEKIFKNMENQIWISKCICLKAQILNKQGEKDSAFDLLTESYSIAINQLDQY